MISITRSQICNKQGFFQRKRAHKLDQAKRGTEEDEPQQADLNINWDPYEAQQHRPKGSH